MIGRRPAWMLAPMLVACIGSGLAAQVPIVGRAVELDSVPLVDSRRLGALPSVERAEWERYLARSRALWTLDRATLDHERRASPVQNRVPAPVGRDFSITAAMTPDWIRSDSARRITEAILSYQTPSGGWAKAVDFSRGPRARGQSFSSQATDWHFTPTIDNDATTDELRLLALAHREEKDARIGAAIERGVAYLLDAQMPNGCWPQVYPLQGGYHDAVTFNDGATIRVVAVLRDLAADDGSPIVSTTRSRAVEAQGRTTRCLVATQVVVNGHPTIWGQQHDPITLAPTSGRSYELTSLAPDESARIGLFLMELPSPESSVRRSVHAAADWYRANAISGRRYEKWRLTDDPAAPPLWGRMVEIGSNRPIFSNRDGIKLYDPARLDDRKTGYRWFTTTPALFLQRYESWAAAHPRH
jgi:PelA/Pel-15E family pectate lyase